MKKIVLILAPIMILGLVIGLTLFAYIKGQEISNDSTNPSAGYEDINNNTEPTQNNNNQSVGPTETKPENENNHQGSSNPNENNQNTEPSNPGENTSGQGSNNQGGNNSGFKIPDETILHIGNSEIKINGESNATDIFKQLNLQYQMTIDDSSYVKMNTYRSIAQDEIEYGAINVIEYVLKDEPRFCGVAMQLQGYEDKLSILGITGNTTLSELNEMFGESDELEGYGTDPMYMQIFDVGDDTILLITTIDPNNNCVKNATVTFWQP